MDLVLQTLTITVEYALLFLALVSVIAFVHELGHYVVARLCGVRVEAFAVGFGREVVGWTNGAGTRFKLCLLPLGGYVKMFCETAPTAGAPIGPEEVRQSYFHRPIGQRAAIVLAGPVANVLFAVAALALLLLAVGRIADGPTGHARVYPGALEAIFEAIEMTGALAADTVRVSAEVATGQRDPEDLAGPVQVAKLAGETTVALGFGALVLFASLLSINVALMNLLPIPVMDGGQLVLLLWEKIRGRRLGRRAHAICSLGGLATVLIVFLLITYKDLTQLGLL